jgi:protein involved in polysaccharide export with SLBB domain
MSLCRLILIQLVLAVALGGCTWLRDPSGIRNLPMLPEDAGTASTADEYRLGAGDIVTVRVYDWRMNDARTAADDDLRLDKIRLDSSGTISLPFGAFTAVGKTPREVEGAIAENLRGRVLRNPRVSVTIDEYRPFYVEGQVGRPGAYPYQPGLNVRKAVTIGGGFRERAAFDKIFLVREADRTNTRYRVNLNSPVRPGDTVTVEESLF